MNNIPETSTTLLKDIGSDVGNVRWGEFVSRYRGMMVSYLKVHFPVLEPDDIIQETLPALAAALPHYRYDPSETGHFRNYLTGILRNKALKRCEKQARERRLMSEYLKIAETASREDAEEAASWRQAVFEIAMRQMLADGSIHDRSKQIFQRLTVDGLPPDEVAAAYGVSRNSVDKIKSRLLARLREIVRLLEVAGDV